MLLLRRAVEWLQRAPIEDALDRRSAPGLQVLLLVGAVLVPLVTFSEWRNAGPSGLAAGIGLMCSLVLWFCLWLVRRGQFRPAAAMVLALLLALIVLSYQIYGLRAQSGLQVAHLLPLLIGGLLLGRAALWWGMAGLMLAVALGAGVDLTQAPEIGLVRDDIRHDLMLAVMTVLISTVMLDRLISASRRALRRSEELDATCRQLAREIEEKERSQAQLLQSQKLELLGRISGGIAHDFNNILGVIMGYAGMARASGGFDDGPIDGIENATRRGAMVTRRLLGLGRNRSRRQEVFDACCAVRQAMTLIGPLFREQVEVHVDLPSEELPVELDRDEFELALLNLASNSRDAMAGGGIFRIAVSAQGDLVLVDVSDTGHGMSSEVSERLFEPFFTTKPEGRGTGIGMAVVQRLMNDADGQVHVESAPGQGTRITLQLPRACMTPGRALVEVAGSHVLLIEDDPELRALLADALGAAGCVVVLAANGTQALSAWPAGAPVPQVLVSDYRLPDTDGISLLRQLGQSWPDAARILITSHRSDAMPSLEEHGIELLRKPFVPAQLLALLRHALTRSRADAASV